MQIFKEYIKMHNESIVKFLVLLCINSFSILIYHENNNFYSFIYLIFIIFITIKIFFNNLCA